MDNELINKGAKTFLYINCPSKKHCFHSPKYIFQWVQWVFSNENLDLNKNKLIKLIIFQVLYLAWSVLISWRRKKYARSKKENRRGTPTALSTKLGATKLLYFTDCGTKIWNKMLNRLTYCLSLAHFWQKIKHLNKILQCAIKGGAVKSFQISLSSLYNFLIVSQLCKYTVKKNWTFGRKFKFSRRGESYKLTE